MLDHGNSPKSDVFDSLLVAARACNAWFRTALKSQIDCYRLSSLCCVAVYKSNFNFS